MSGHPFSAIVSVEYIEGHVPRPPPYSPTDALRYFQRYFPRREVRGWRPQTATTNMSLYTFSFYSIKQLCSGGVSRAALRHVSAPYWTRTNRCVLILVYTWKHSSLLFPVGAAVFEFTRFVVQSHSHVMLIDMQRGTLIEENIICYITKNICRALLQSGPHLYQFQTKILSWVTTHTMKIC